VEAVGDFPDVDECPTYRRGTTIGYEDVALSGASHVADEDFVDGVVVVNFVVFFVDCLDSKKLAHKYKR
jgi:hypothetical protein